MLVVAFASLFVRFHSVSLQVTFAVFVAFAFGIAARVVITMVTLVPFSMSPMYQDFVVLSYVPLLVTYSTCCGRMSVTLTFVAFVPFAALVTVMVQTIVSFTKYSSFSTVFSIDRSTNGSTLIVSFTVLFNPFGAMRV